MKIRTGIVRGIAWQRTCHRGPWSKVFLVRLSFAAPWGLIAAACSSPGPRLGPASDASPPDGANEVFSPEDAGAYDPDANLRGRMHRRLARLPCGRGSHPGRLRGRRAMSWLRVAPVSLRPARRRDRGRRLRRGSPRRPGELATKLPAPQGDGDRHVSRQPENATGRDAGAGRHPGDRRLDLFGGARQLIPSARSSSPSGGIQAGPQPGGPEPSPQRISSIRWTGPSAPISGADLLRADDCDLQRHQQSRIHSSPPFALCVPGRGVAASALPPCISPPDVRRMAVVPP